MMDAPTSQWRGTVFGLLALIPAALNATPATGAGGITAVLCTAPGVYRTVTIPTGGGPVPQKDPSTCCAKGCHSSSRKRMTRGDNAS